MLGGQSGKQGCPGTDGVVAGTSPTIGFASYRSSVHNYTVCMCVYSMHCVYTYIYACIYVSESP